MHERDVAEQGGTSQNTGAETTRQGRRFDSDCDHRARPDMIVGATCRTSHLLVA
jgi:hypothetical protein